MSAEAAKSSSPSRYGQKLIEALVFFSQKGKLRNPSKMMLYKLLAQFDFRHFEATGLPVTDQTYHAFPYGPVPQPLHDEITKEGFVNLPKDLSEALKVEETEFVDDEGRGHRGFRFTTKRKPNLKVFSARQQQILADILEIYKDATPTEASKASHEPDTPWTITVKRKGEAAIIDFLETLKLTHPLTKDIAHQKLRERGALDYNYDG
jgi:uncharacterized phage-associated protein